MLVPFAVEIVLCLTFVSRALIVFDCKHFEQQFDPAQSTQSVRADER